LAIGESYHGPTGIVFDRGTRSLFFADSNEGVIDRIR
jgi:hypothetical protein